MNFTPPPITQGPWEASKPIPGNHGVWSITEKSTATIGAIATVNGKNNARAIGALPAVLTALEAAYRRAAEKVKMFEHACLANGHAVEGLQYLRLVEIRNEYQTALELAGYQFTP